jgi:hypothetical protein
MPKATVPFGEWRPDIATLDSQFANVADNVYAGINSYKPIPDLLRFSATPLPDSPICGLTSARAADGSWKIYAGTKTKLWTWALAGWTDVSRTVGGAYNVPTGQLWSFAQFGQNLIAVSGVNDNPQTINVDTGTNFADLAGSPPKAHTVAQIGDFLILAGLASNGRSIQWSGINDSTSWTPGLNLSDIQSFPEGGPVTSVQGGEIGYVVQDRAIRTMQFLPGDTTYIFNFSRVLRDKGCVSTWGATTVGNVLYFLAEDGFYSITGQGIVPIGQDKINEWFLANSDVGRRNLVETVISNKPYVAWAFHSSSAPQSYDRVLIYNWSNGRWSTGTVYALAWAQLATIPLDLDTTGPEPGDANLDSTASSLDSFAYVGGRPQVCAFDANGYLCSLTGPNLRATMETGEAHLVPGQRTFVSDAYPLADAIDGTVTVATRERLQDAVVWGPDVPLEITGSASVLTSSRLHRFRVTIPRGDTWTHAQAVAVEAQPDGMA